MYNTLEILLKYHKYACVRYLSAIFLRQTFDINMYKQGLKISISAMIFRPEIILKCLSG